MQNLPKISSEAKIALGFAVDNKDPVSVLEELGISQRMINLLQENNIQNMCDLMSKKPNQLLNLKNFGQKQLQNLFVALSKYHLIND